MGEMVVPILAGILSALRRVIARRVSLKVLNSSIYIVVWFPVGKWLLLTIVLLTAFFLRALCETLMLILAIACCQNQLKRRLNAITITSATCFLFPVAMWDFITVSYRSEIFSPVFNLLYQALEIISLFKSPWSYGLIKNLLCSVIKLIITNSMRKIGTTQGLLCFF